MRTLGVKNLTGENELKDFILELRIKINFVSYKLIIPFDYQIDLSYFSIEALPQFTISQLPFSESALCDCPIRLHCKT